MLNIKESKKQTNYFIMILLFGVLAWELFEALKTTYDNDGWWLFATGREILENGFPKYNPWSIHDGMETVIQQWVPSVILYLLYSLGKMPLIEIYVAVLVLCFTFLTYRMCRLCSDDRCGGEFIFALVLLALYPISRYFSCRPQVYSMAAYVGIIWLLELYRKTGALKYIMWFPLITLVHVNFHSSMALYDLFIIGAYWIPDVSAIIKKRFGKCCFQFACSSYPRKPLFIVGIASALTMILNPYGLKGALYLFESYGAADYGDYISEMQPLQLASGYGWCILALIVAGCIVIGYNGINKINFPLSFLFLVSIVLTVQHIRNLWFTPLFAMPLIASSVGKWEINFSKVGFLKRKLVYALEIFLIFDAVFLYGYSTIWPTLVNYIHISKDDAMDLPQKAAEYMKAYATENNLEANEIKVFNTFNNGGLLEYYGFKVFMDPRPELWEPMITGCEEHYYQEYVDFQNGEVEIEEIMDKYYFDFYIVREDSAMEEYMQEHVDLYQIVEECNGYNLWGNVNS